MTIAKALLVTSAWALAAVVSVAQQATDIAGVWDVTFNTSEGAAPAQLTIKRDGEKLGGTLVTQHGESPVEVIVKDKDVTMRFAHQTGNGPIAVVMKGTINGDAMSGTADVEGRSEVQWTAKRTAPQAGGSEKTSDSKEAKLDVSGTWNVSVATATISANPTIVLKQDGEKITGQYISSQYGEFPLEGTLKGKAINFSFTMTIEGNALLVSYAGTAERDSMSGSVVYGDFADGTFAAKRR
jgi:hypothetical protein